MARPNDDESMFPRSSAPAQGPVECLGLPFPHDQARRDHFLEKLRERLHDPDFRKIEGFPLGTECGANAKIEPNGPRRWVTQAWEQLVSRIRFFMPRPCGDINRVHLSRRDDPPGFRVVREATVNLLIHQDYAEHSSKAVIKCLRDGIQFWNPGDTNEHR